MVDKRFVKIGLRVCFLLIQGAIILAGLFSLVLLVPIYIRLRSILIVPICHVIPVMLEILFTATTGILGCACMVRKKKLVTFAFIISLIALMNLQIVLAFKSGMMVERVRPWLATQWSAFSDEQKNYAQEQLKCCGLETKSDSPGSVCHFKGSCMDKFVSISKTVRGVVQHTLLLMFFVETIGLSIIALLRYGKGENGNRES